MRSPIPQEKWIINRKNGVREEEKCGPDRTGPFQMNASRLPAEMQGSIKGKSGRSDALASPLRMTIS
jgi:hypothetical protein